MPETAKAEGINWHPRVRVLQYGRDTMSRIIDKLGYEPVDGELMAFTPDNIVHDERNQCVTVGLNLIGNLIVGAGGAAFNSSQSIIGVGSSSTAFSVSQTALGGDGSTSTAYYQATGVAPTQSNGVISAQTTFATGNANFVWNEWCLSTGTGTITAGGTLASVATSTTMLNRKVVSLGTKGSGTSWVIQITLTLS